MKIEYSRQISFQPVCMPLVETDMKYWDILVKVLYCKQYT